MQTPILVRTSASPDPLVRYRGLWEVCVCGERWFGPDTLAACLEAKHTLEPIVKAAMTSLSPIASRRRT